MFWSEYCSVLEVIIAACNLFCHYFQRAWGAFFFENHALVTIFAVLRSFDSKNSHSVRMHYCLKHGMSQLQLKRAIPPLDGALRSRVEQKETE